MKLTPGEERKRKNFKTFNNSTFVFDLILIYFNNDNGLNIAFAAKLYHGFSYNEIIIYELQFDHF